MLEHMERREKFAAIAMGMMARNAGKDYIDAYAVEIASAAVKYADALIAELDKKPEVQAVKKKAKADKI